MYSEVLGRQVENAAHVARLEGLHHLIWPPVGMGAYMRHMSHNDKRAVPNPEGFNRVPRSYRHFVAETIVHRLVLDLTPEDHVMHHIILPHPASNAEGQMIIDAFTSAVQCLGPVRVQKNITLHCGRDMFELGMDLQDFCIRSNMFPKAEATTTVGMVNAGSRIKLGNHYYREGAMQAVDENCARRSESLRHMYHLINQGRHLRYGATFCTDPRILQRDSRKRKDAEVKQEQCSLLLNLVAKHCFPDPDENRAVQIGRIFGK